MLPNFVSLTIIKNINFDLSNLAAASCFERNFDVDLVLIDALLCDFSVK